MITPGSSLEVRLREVVEYVPESEPGERERDSRRPRPYGVPEEPVV